MSLFVRDKSCAYRLRDAGKVNVEHFGQQHQHAPLLEWGSITKTVTAGIAEQLNRAGVIDLKAPVAEYLPETALPETVDVSSLVEHTSGLPRLPKKMITNSAEARDPYAKYTTEYFDTKVLPGLVSQKLGQPGAYEYSNLGYAVLTRLLEIATGCSWWTLARREVLNCLEIKDVFITSDPIRSPGLRIWFGGVCKQWSFPGPFVGVGGLHGGFEALEQYAIAVSQRPFNSVPFGWIDDDPKFWWHNGHTLDHGAFVGVSRDGSLVVTVHTLGYSPGRADKIFKRLLRQYPRL